VRHRSARGAPRVRIARALPRSSREVSVIPRRDEKRPSQNGGHGHFVENLVRLGLAVVLLDSVRLDSFLRARSGVFSIFG
jgi:hypothetical protein